MVAKGRPEKEIKLAVSIFWGRCSWDSSTQRWVDNVDLSDEAASTVATVSKNEELPAICLRLQTEVSRMLVRFDAQANRWIKAAQRESDAPHEVGQGASDVEYLVRRCLTPPHQHLEGEGEGERARESERESESAFIGHRAVFGRFAAGG